MRIFLFLLVLALFAPGVAAAEGLLPFFDVAAVRAAAGAPDKKPFECKPPPAPLRDLVFESRYDPSDKTRATVDPEADTAYKAAYAPAAAFERGLSAMANRYVRARPPRPEIAACARGWLRAWAEGGALLGKTNAGGVMVRKWLLASAANGWLQVAGEDAEVTAWLRSVAEQVRRDFTAMPEKNSRRNNHLYWAAWGVASAAVAANDGELFGWAMEGARRGIGDIRGDGTLELELARGGRACLYHHFAALPLFFLAETGARNGIDLFGEGLGRLGRLNLGGCAAFGKMTGAQQAEPGAASLGWIEIYERRYPGDARARKALEDLRPLRQSRMGGNVTLLHAGIR